MTDLEREAEQVLTATPAAAIAGLRRCATLCPHIGANALPYPALAPVVKPSPMSTTVAADYRLFIDCVKARRGFWSEAGKLARTAGWYRHALAVADQTRRSQEQAKSGDHVDRRAARGRSNKLD